METLRKEIEQEMMRVRIDKGRLFDLLLKIVDNCGAGGSGSVGSVGSVGPAGPAGPAGPRGVQGVAGPEATKKLSNPKLPRGCRTRSYQEGRRPELPEVVASTKKALVKKKVVSV